MYHKNKPIGLILGSGLLTKSLIDSCKKKKQKYRIIAIDNNYSREYGKPDLIINYNNIGSIFKYLNKNSISQVVFLGKVKKINIFKYRPNFITLYYLLKLVFFYNRGDGKLIDKIIKIFLRKNINIVDPRDLLQKNLCNNNNNNHHKFKKMLTLKKIKNYFLLAKKNGEKDLGQAVIVSNNKIILTEDRYGTDNLIKRFKLHKPKIPSYLVKVSKPNQNLKIDLPTIGPTTIINMADVGLKGIIVEHNKTFIENPTLTFKIIKEKKLLFYAV